ncbi:MAG: hypothetical protein RLZZ584_2340 [Pseudomonadota bacterium]
MEYNPFTQRHAALQLQLQSVEAERDECSKQLAWHAQFKAEAEAEALATHKREAARVQAALDGLKARRANVAQIAQDLSGNARLGLDPRRWFSAERAEQVRQRDAARALVEQLDQAITTKQAQAAQILQANQRRQAQMEKHRALDALELQARLRALDQQLAPLRPQLAALLADRERVDAQLAAPLQEQQRLDRQLAQLEGELERARGFEQRLGAAANGRDKAEIHNECGLAFGGESSPGRVMQDRQRGIEAARRNLAKVQARLARIAQLASRPIATLVLDGNNLCYEGQQFIGLEAALALSYALADDRRHKVVVVFDASIRRLLGMADQQIAHGFPTRATVHVVASRQGADQTVLEMAAAPDAWVISNDRFRDYTDKPAVRDERLIRHEIVAGQVMVHDLDLRIGFAPQVTVRPLRAG